MLDKFIKLIDVISIKLPLKCDMTDLQRYHLIPFLIQNKWDRFIFFADSLLFSDVVSLENVT